MYNNSLKIPLLQEVSTCSYPMMMRDFVVNQIIEIYSYKETIQGPRRFKKQLGNDLIIMILFPLRVPYKMQAYDITLQILLMKNFPNEAPQIFLEQVPGSAINPRSSEIDQNTRRIMTKSLTYWNSTFTMSCVLEEIRQSFMRIFPLYKPPSSSIPVQQQPNSNINTVYNTTQQRPQVYGNNVYNNFANQLGQSFVGGSLFGNQVMTSTYPHPQSIYAKLGINNNNNKYPNQTNPQNFANQNNNMIYQQYQQGKTFTNTQAKGQTNASPEDKAKEILIHEIQSKIEGKVKKESRQINKEASTLLNYQKQFNTEINKLDSFTNGNNLQMKIENQMNFVDREKTKITNYLNSKKRKEINGNNIMDFISMSERDNRIIKLIAKEAYLEDMLTLCKKGFERHNIAFLEATKFTRQLSREIFSTRFLREKIAAKF